MILHLSPSWKEGCPSNFDFFEWIWKLDSSFFPPHLNRTNKIGQISQAKIKIENIILYLSSGKVWFIQIWTISWPNQDQTWLRGPKKIRKIVRSTTYFGADLVWKSVFTSRVSFTSSLGSTHDTRISLLTCELLQMKCDRICER